MEVTHHLGGANYVLWAGARDTRPCLQHRHAAGGRPARPVHDDGGGAQEPDRLRRHDPDRAQAVRADQAPIRPRRRDGARLPPALRAGEGDQAQTSEVNHATLAGHSYEHEICYAIANDLMGSFDINAATRRTAGTHRPVPQRPARRPLALYRHPVAAGSPPADSTSTPRSGASRSTLEDLFHAHIGGMDTLAGACSPPRRWSRRAASPVSSRTWVTPAGTAPWGREKSWTAGDPGRSRQARQDRSLAAAARKSGRQEYLENWVNRFV